MRFVNRKPRKANHDVITVHVATTTDGIAFTEVGSAMGLFDPSTISLSGTRWLGSGSLIPLADGHYGMFFGAGNCLDNDSDGFHYIGYAETKNVVNTPADLLNWSVLNQLDNPILSTDTVTDPTGPRPYPQTSPVVNVHGVDALTPAQVAPFMPPPGPNPPPGGYNSNFFSGRVYDPQAIYTNDHTLTIVFAGYNTPQPSNNLVRGARSNPRPLYRDRRLCIATVKQRGICAGARRQSSSAATIIDLVIAQSSVRVPRRRSGRRSVLRLFRRLTRTSFTGNFE